MVFFDGQNDISLEGVEGGIMVDGWKIRPLNPTKVQRQNSCIENLYTRV